MGYFKKIMDPWDHTEKLECIVHICKYKVGTYIHIDIHTYIQTSYTITQLYMNAHALYIYGQCSCR